MEIREADFIRFDWKRSQFLQIRSTNCGVWTDYCCCRFGCKHKHESSSFPFVIAWTYKIVESSFKQVRLSVGYASSFGSQLNWKERLYVTISGFPKATVQAALGPVALDQVRLHNIDSSSIEAQMANIVLIVSVLAIVITAPLGAILMVKLAPKFLQKCHLPPISSW